MLADASPPVIRAIVIPPDEPRPEDRQVIAGYLIIGIAVVYAQPHRRTQDARRLAQSIAVDPSAYLDVCNRFNVEGIEDQRPTYTGHGRIDQASKLRKLVAEGSANVSH